MDLKIKKLCHSYEENKQKYVVLDNIDFNFKKGNIYSIYGVSSSGKSSLFAYLSGLESVNNDIILLGEQDFANITSDKIRKKFVSIILDDLHVVNYLTVAENLKLAFDMTDSQVEQDHIMKEIEDVLATLNIKFDSLDSQARTLSRFDRLVVSIVRAVLMKTAWIILDDSTSRLDLTQASQIVELLKKINVIYKVGIIFGTNVEQLAMLVDNQLQLKDSKLHF